MNTAADIGTLLWEVYGLTAESAERSSVGAGSDTWFIRSGGEKYVVKFPSESDMNHPEQEAAVCAYLTERGLPVSEFIRNRRGELLSRDGEGWLFHVQRFVEGRVYEPHTAPDWLLWRSAELLGRLHAALRDYKGLPTGIGADFFRSMTPERALQSCRRSLETARRLGDGQSEAELRCRIGLLERFPKIEIDLSRLTCQSSHGDYFVSQLLCGEGRINAVIDWTTACVHPVAWELLRSYLYASPRCRGGGVDRGELGRYVDCYLKYSPLSDYDIEAMPRLYYYQIAVCDYYGQYYASRAANRHIYLEQARFATRLLQNGGLV